MEDIYSEMIAVSRQIASSFPPPRFYACCRPWMTLSRRLFCEDPQVVQCRTVVQRELRNNYGHGLDHGEKVAVEAGALICMEAEKLSFAESVKKRAGVLAQMAGLLHDLRRGEKDHAHLGAAAAEEILQGFSLSAEEGRMIVDAIANHEAFVEPKKLESVLGQMVSDVLYDADKFRWGPDNFTLTLWEMLRYSQASIVRLIRRFPKGMKGIARIQSTFRSEAGKTYGPEFIDLGLQIGEKILEFLRERFAAELAQEKNNSTAEHAETAEFKQKKKE
jgi:hypothetical protein